MNQYSTRAETSADCSRSVVNVQYVTTSLLRSCCRPHAQCSSLDASSAFSAQAVFRAGDPRVDIFIVERGSVASRGRMLGPGGLMGLKLALLHSAAEHGRQPGGESDVEDGAATWDHTAVSLSYVNMLTLSCQHFDKCVLRSH